MSENILSILITAALSGISGLFGFFVSKKRSQAEIEKLKGEINSDELSNVEKAIGIYRELADDLSNKLKNLTAKCDELQAEIDLLVTENKALKEQIASLTKQLASFGK